ncbi:MAG TPA: DEAD/DEAH box helicase [Polyangia bacterium]|jgi:ATP-dependent RNA helicase RhlE|nr:DEAD/DEAH box helicase [Polyangia bacterium]
MDSFLTLGLIEQLQRAVTAAGYDTPTPIQSQAIPHLLAGRDVLGCAQTGTGKTAAFALPILDRLSRTARRPGSRGPRALVLTPTRELALQINEGFATYGRHVAPKCAVIFGGVGQGPQVDALRRNTDIIVATPGRLIDLMEQRHAHLDSVEMLVLDEADRMLDMGFIEPIRRIVGALPRQRQNLLFSATMPESIMGLANKILVNPIKVAVTPVSSTAEKVTQWVLHVERGNKRALLKEVLRDPAMTRVLVFTRTKHGANRVAEELDKKGVPSAAIHGNKSQNARQRALDAFKGGRIRVLVATDIAARGIDVDGVTHVVNFEIPDEPESYVHRIGRTARAGASGVALSFCDAEERGSWRDIERLIRAQVPVVTDHPFAGKAAPADADGPRDRAFGRPQRPGGYGRSRQGRGGGGGRGRSFGARPSA